MSRCKALIVWAVIGFVSLWRVFNPPQDPRYYLSSLVMISSSSSSPFLPENHHQNNNTSDATNDDDDNDNEVSDRSGWSPRDFYMAYKRHIDKKITWYARNVVPDGSPSCADTDNTADANGDAHGAHPHHPAAPHPGMSAHPGYPSAAIPPGADPYAAYHLPHGAPTEKKKRLPHVVQPYTRYDGLRWHRGPKVGYEFGYELQAIIPWLYAHHTTGQRLIISNNSNSQQQHNTTASYCRFGPGAGLPSTRYLYFFVEEFTERKNLSRAKMISLPPDNPMYPDPNTAMAAQPLNIHLNYSDASRFNATLAKVWKMPPYREFFGGDGGRGGGIGIGNSNDRNRPSRPSPSPTPWKKNTTKKLIVIFNKYTTEWGAPPVNYLPVDALGRMVQGLVSREYQVVYVRVTDKKLMDDGETMQKLRRFYDKEMLRTTFAPDHHGDDVIVIDDLINSISSTSSSSASSPPSSGKKKNDSGSNVTVTTTVTADRERSDGDVVDDVVDYNLLLFGICAQADGFLSVQGGNSVVASLFGKTNLIYAVKGSELTMGTFDSSYASFSGAQIRTTKNISVYESMVNDTFL